MKQGKAWGMTEEVFASASVAVHHLDILAGGYSSEHIHSSKANVLFVLYGKLEISQWAGEMLDVTVLEAGQSTRIDPGVWHRFRAIERTSLIEIYELRFSGTDIERRASGGR